MKLWNKETYSLLSQKGNCERNRDIAMWKIILVRYVFIQAMFHKKFAASAFSLPLDENLYFFASLKARLTFLWKKLRTLKAVGWISKGKVFQDLKWSLTLGFLRYVRVVCFIGGSLSHLSGCFCLLLQNFGKVTETYLWMVLCYSINACWLVGSLRGGGDSQILLAVIKFVWTFCTQRWWGHLKHAVILSLLNIFDFLAGVSSLFCSFPNLEMKCFTKDAPKYSFFKMKRFSSN